MAAGLSIEGERIGEFRRFVCDYVNAHAGEADQAESVEIDAILSLRAASRAFFDKLDLLAPYGQGNPEPLLAFAGVRIGYASVMKGGHIRCDLTDGKRSQAERHYLARGRYAVGGCLAAPDGACACAGAPESR